MPEATKATLKKAAGVAEDTLGSKVRTRIKSKYSYNVSAVVHHYVLCILRQSVVRVQYLHTANKKAS